MCCSARSLLLFLSFLLMTLTGSAQPPSSEKPKPVPDNPVAQDEPEDTIRVRTDLVVIDALVMQRETSRIVGGLKPENFTLYEDGVKQTITNFSQDKLPLSVILLLDVSGSMQRVIDQMQHGALRALAQLKPEDEVAIVAYASKATVIQGFTKERSLIADRIAETNEVARRQGVGSGTILRAGLELAAYEMRHAASPISRRVIIVVTDNQASKNPLKSAKEIQDDILESGSVVCGLLVNQGGINALAPSGKIGKMARIAGIIGIAASGGSIGAIAGAGGAAGVGMLMNEGVEGYVQKTGGETMSVSRQDVSEKLTVMLEHLRSRYAIGYEPTNQNYDGKFRKLKLQIDPDVEKREGRLIIRTRQGWYAKPRAEAADRTLPARRDFVLPQ